MDLDILTKPIHVCDRCQEASVDPQARVADYFGDWYQDLCQACSEDLLERQAAYRIMIRGGGR